MDRANAGIIVYFGLPSAGGGFFTLDDPTLGLLDGSALLGGDLGTPIGGDAYQLQIKRGRNRELDEFEAGQCQVELRNIDRTYDNTNAASPLFGTMVPGCRITVDLWGQRVYDGFTEDWDNDWPVDGPASATLAAVDGLGQLGMRYFDAWTTTDEQQAGARLTSALNRTEVAYGISRDFDTGITNLQDDTVTWGSNVLNYLQLVAKSDAGRLFVTRDGVLRYQDRHSLLNPTSIVDFADDGTGVAFHGVTTTTGADLLYNRVGVDRVGGTLQTAQDTTSQAAIGIRQLSLSQLLMNSDSDSIDLAAYLLAIYKDPATRVSSIMVKVNALAPDDRGAVTALDIGDVVSISWTPAGVGSPLEQTLVVEGVEHQVDAQGFHVMWLYTSVAQQVGVFVLDDPVWGLLDAGIRLAY